LPGLLFLEMEANESLYARIANVNIAELPAFETFVQKAVAGETWISPEDIIKEDGTIPYELALQIASDRNRQAEVKPREFTAAPIGTLAMDRYGELWVLASLPLDAVVQTEGTDQTNATVEKYAGWLKDGSRPLPAWGVQNIAVYAGGVRLNDGHHRFSAARMAGMDEHPVWVSLTDPKNPTCPIKETGPALLDALRMLVENGGARLTEKVVSMPGPNEHGLDGVETQNHLSL